MVRTEFRNIAYQSEDKRGTVNLEGDFIQECSGGVFLYIILW